MTPITKSIAALMLLSAVAAAQAQNIGFLRSGPVADLSPEEQDMVRDAFARALNEAADSETVEWENPESGHAGRIEVLDIHEDYGTTCRTVRTWTTAGGREGGALYRLCKADDGSWRFAPARRSTS